MFSFLNFTPHVSYIVTPKVFSEGEYSSDGQNFSVRISHSPVQSLHNNSLSNTVVIELDTYICYKLERCRCSGEEADH